MLKILLDGEKYEGPCALLLGGFDGLHLGHRALLERAKKTGFPVGITTIFGGKGSALFTKEEREFLFARAGVEFALEWEFTGAFEKIPAEEFLRALFARVKPETVVCGEDFRFGRGAAGTAELLKALAPCPVEVLPPVRSADLRAAGSGELEKISTSACKEHLAKGELALLNAYLQTTDFYGSAYFIGGEVEHGRQIGRTYGFPTLNLSVRKEKALPPDGVYFGLCGTPAGNFPAIVNFGARPTFGVEERKIEAYLDGFSGDLYGAYVRVYPMGFLRPVQTFSSAEALKEQLMRDILVMRANEKERHL